MNVLLKCSLSSLFGVTNRSIYEAYAYIELALYQFIRFPDAVERSFDSNQAID